MPDTKDENIHIPGKRFQSHTKEKPPDIDRTESVSGGISNIPLNGECNENTVAKDGSMFIDYLQPDQDGYVYLKERWDMDNLKRLIESEHIGPELKKIYSINLKELTRNKSIVVRYKVPRDVKQEDYKNFKGRLTVTKDLGLTRVKKEHRRLLSGNNYYDLDIKKCQPSILLNIGNIYFNKDYKYIYKYVNDFDAVCDEILESHPELQIVVENDDFFSKTKNDKTLTGKPAIKHIINAISNGCNYKKRFGLIDVGFFDDYANQIKDIYSKIKGDERFKHITSKRYTNQFGSVMSKVFCEGERLVISGAFYFLRNHKDITPEVYAFDDLMIPINQCPEELDELLTGLNNYIKETIGFNVTFVNKCNKPTDEDLALIDVNSCNKNDITEQGINVDDMSLEDILATKDYDILKKAFEKMVFKVKYSPMFFQPTEYDGFHQHTIKDLGIAFSEWRILKIVYSVRTFHWRW